MKRVIGIGGIFFKCQDPEKVKEWYKTHLGFEVNAYGTTFEQSESVTWSPFADKTDYFAPSTKEFMVNYRVENLEALVAALKAEGVTVLDEITSYPYGKFVHILDIEGNKIELWEA